MLQIIDTMTPYKQVFIVLTNLCLLSDLLVNWFRLPLVLVQSLLLYIYNDPTITPYYGHPVIMASFFWPVGVRINRVALYSVCLVTYNHGQKSLGHAAQYYSR